MPAQKRPHEDEDGSPPTQQDDDARNRPVEEEGNESDRTLSSTSSGHQLQDEFITIRLSDIRKEVQCPICLGIIRKTRTVMECLHRFCRECIDKSMRLGNNECPACRTHCASRRSLRDDPNYDALIAALYPDIDMYEEEELAFHEEEKARNKQIQASIAQTCRRQTEALGRKRMTARATAAACTRRSQSRRRRNSGAADIQISDDEEEDDNEGSRDLSSADDPCTEVKPKRSKRRGGARISYPSSAADGMGDENELEMPRETIGASIVGVVSKSERLAWGKGGIRSNTRYGSAGGSSGKIARNSRLSKLVNCLQNMQENGDKLDINIMLVSYDERRIPSLQRPFLSCSPSLSIKHLCEHIALQTQFITDEIEILMVKEKDSNLNSSTSISDPLASSTITEMCNDEMQTLDAQDTLVGIRMISNLSKGHMLLAYRPKASA